LNDHCRWRVKRPNTPVSANISLELPRSRDVFDKDASESRLIRWGRYWAADLSPRHVKARLTLIWIDPSFYENLGLGERRVFNDAVSRKNTHLANAFAWTRDMAIDHESAL
jgi:hypothetical protein